jgi:protein TonB
MARPVPPTASVDPRPSKIEPAPAPAPSAPTPAMVQPVPPPPRPKSAPAAKATPSAKTTEKAAAPKQGIKRAVEGQTASLGAPTGGDRLGRSENDGASGVLNVNLNPRFRQPPPPPRYPRLSVERDEEGVVLVRAYVDPAGAPQRVIVFRSSGFPLLDDAALKAVQGWRFEPMVRDGRATAAWVQVPVRFRLN